MLGQRYRLGSVRFIDNTVASEETLRAEFGIEDGEWYVIAGKFVMRFAELNHLFVTAAMPVRW